MASATSKQSKKLRVLLMPFFATSHIGPFTDLAFHLAAARPGAVEATVAVTHANASVVGSALSRRGRPDDITVEVATYEFPAVDGLPPGVENFSTVSAADAWRVDVTATDEKLLRPEQERLIRERSPDVIINDVHYFWNVDVAADLGVPCVTFHAIGTFSMLAMFKLVYAGVHATTDGEVTVPGFPSPEIRVPVTELPEFLRTHGPLDRRDTVKRTMSTLSRCLGLAVNTFSDLEQRYCQMYVRDGFAKRAYFVGPVALPLPTPVGTNADSPCIQWLDMKPTQSVVYLCFGSLTHVSEVQLRELALGLQSSGKPFLWVIRASTWSAPEGWKERVGDRGMVVTGWAPQTAILAHPAVGAFVTHCGWNSVMETVAAGVPVLTWPMVLEQFITERFVAEIIKIGERLVPEEARVMRSTRSEKCELVPAEVVAQAVARFMEPGGAGDAARNRVKELSAKANAAMAEGGSSHRDLHRLIDDLVEERAAAAAGKVVR